MLALPAHACDERHVDWVTAELEVEVLDDGIEIIGVGIELIGHRHVESLVA